MNIFTNVKPDLPNHKFLNCGCEIFSFERPLEGENSWSGSGALNSSLIKNYNLANPKTGITRLIKVIGEFQGTHNGFPQYYVDEDNFLVVSFKIIDNSSSNCQRFFDIYNNLSDDIIEDNIIFSWE